MAMTTKYCSVTGAGAKNGTDAANAWDWASMLAGANAGDYVLVQEGTYTLAASSSFSNSGTSTSPIRLRGAKTDWTPLSPTRTNAGALSTTNMPVIAYNANANLEMPAASIIESLKITANIGGATLIIGFESAARGVIAENASTGAGSSLCCVSPKARSLLIDSDLSLTGASGVGAGACVVCTGADAKIIANRITAGSTSGKGVTVGAVGGIQVIANVIYGGANYLIAITSTSGDATIVGNTLVGPTGGTSDGINIVASNLQLNAVVANLITDCTRYGINGNNAANGIVSAMNRVDRCTSGAYNGATDWLASTKWGDDVTSATAANEYENAGSGDYRLKSTSPAIGKGAWLLGDIGALQAAASAGGGGGPVIGCGFIRGRRT